MSLYSLASIRQSFLSYFEKNQHTIVSSSSLVPSNDPTLMFTNSGMVQFKDVFTGKEKRPYTRATTSQRCLRAGGKHNDLENVGHTARHHTFFEMLGNFSFGDYFKEQAIFYAWEFITKQISLPKDKLCVTVFAEDDDAYALWQKIAGLPAGKIIRIGTSDNFWSMGDTGPCGPCSEIFYDHGDHIFGGPPGSPDENGDRFIEVWNLVFMQYEQLADGTRINLPNPSIDTGMGLERIAAIVQGQHNNYDIDLFKNLVDASVMLTKNTTMPNAHRVIADHIRAVSFLIADGVMPSNEGRGYVLRRILRRAMRYINQLGVHEPLFYQLVKPLVTEMGDAYPELTRGENLITHTIHTEEERFLETLSKGMTILEEANSIAGPIFPGDVAFKLYDTYGFPLDLTADALKMHNKTIDTETYDACMEKQRCRSRAAWSGTGDIANDKLWFDLKADHGASEFVGYTHNKAQGIVLAMVETGFPGVTDSSVTRVETVSTGIQEKELDPGSAACGLVRENSSAAVTTHAHHGQEVWIITNQTPFYGESGGQMGDTGTITTEGGTLVCVLDTHKKADGLIIHRGILEKGDLHTGDTVTLCIDTQRRDNLRKNHSATHLLHAALRKFLGDHVSQKGSLVASDKLRFDFSHTMPVSESQIKQIECWVNARVMEAHTVITEVLSQDAAKEKGAMALFGEKYGDLVRVVTMGAGFPGVTDSCAQRLESVSIGIQNKELDPGSAAIKNNGLVREASCLAAMGDQHVSIELCGGTHVNNLGEIGCFKIISESGIASGIRRIEAIVGFEIFNYIDGLQEQVQATERKNLEQYKKMKKEIETYQKALLHVEMPVEIHGVSVLAKYVDHINAGILRQKATELVQANPEAVVILLSKEEKFSCVIGVGKNLLARFDAREIAKKAATLLGGAGGGGQPHLAAAGGTVCNNWSEFLASCIG